MANAKPERELHFSVLWSAADGEYVGRCSRYPSLSHLHRDADQTLIGIVELVLDVLQHPLEPEPD